MLQKIKEEFNQGRTLLLFTSLQVTGQSLGMVVPLVVVKFFSPDFVWRLLPKKADILRR